MENENPGIIKFYAQWCQPCKMMNPVWEKLIETHGSSINFSEIDVEEDKFAEIVESFGVQSVPTFVFINKQGEWVSYNGVMTYPRMVDLIKEHLN